MCRLRVLILAVAMVTGAALAAAQRHFNESEQAIAVNPTKPQQYPWRSSR